jgi:hypothetical protein
VPAVLLTRLEQQIKAFSSTFDRPEIFATNLIALLELYSDRTYQAGYEVPPSSKMISYRVPSVVMRALELEFRQLAKKQPKDALLVADQLWSGHKLELRQLGISLLGFVPLELSNQVMERIEIWAPSCSDRFLLEDLLTKSNSQILQEKPALWIEKSRKWLSSRDSKLILLGVKSLEPLLSTENFNDLPQIIDSIHSLVVNLKVDVFPEVLHLFEILIQKHPTETVVFLKQIIFESPVSATLRLIRKILPSLPNTVQVSIREAMEKTNPSPLASPLQSSKIKSNQKTVKKRKKN